LKYFNISPSFPYDWFMDRGYGISVVNYLNEDLIPLSLGVRQKKQFQQEVGF
jgi:hypothetical protein